MNFKEKFFQRSCEQIAMLNRFYKLPIIPVKYATRVSQQDTNPNATRWLHCKQIYFHNKISSKRVEKQDRKELFLQLF